MKKIIRTQNGWSLVEVITVLIIIVVAAAFAAPDIITWGENTRVTSAARDFIADLNNARVAAVDENSSVVVNLDVANDNYVIFVDNGGAVGSGGVANNDTLDLDVDGTTRLETVLGEKNFADDNYRGAVIDNSTIAAPFGFDPRGLPLDGHTGNILIRNSDSDVWLKIVVSSAGALTLLKSNNSTDGTDGTWK